MVGLLAVVVLILHEKVLVGAVAREEDGCRAESGERAAVAVPAGEDTLESPGVTAPKPVC